MKTKYFILSALALILVACEANFFETESPSAMDEAVFKSADMTEQAIGAIYNTFGEDIETNRMHVMMLDASIKDKHFERHIRTLIFLSQVA